MYVNENGKYTSPAECFYNPYICLYCIVGHTFAMEHLSDIEDLFESPDLLTEVEMPDYITEDYDGVVW